MDMKIEMPLSESFFATEKKKAIKEEIVKLITEAIESSGKKEMIGDLLFDLCKADKLQQNMYIIISTKF